MNAIHYTAKQLLSPTDQVTIHLIGAGGTGSQMLTALSRMSHSLIQLQHPGFKVILWDDDKVSEANLGRQLFATAEIGFYKADVLISRVNRFFGSNWKAMPYRYTASNLKKLEDDGVANIVISCVDTVRSRRDIAAILKGVKVESYGRRQPYYWLDFGNSKQSGQVILSTIRPISQPKSEKYRPVGVLPFVTDEYGDELNEADTDDTPSCSLAEALEKQDLFINSTLANMGSSLLWSLFRNGMTENRGFFLNLADFRTQPLKVA